MADLKRAITSLHRLIALTQMRQQKLEQLRAQLTNERVLLEDQIESLEVERAQLTSLVPNHAMSMAGRGFWLTALNAAIGVEHKRLADLDMRLASLDRDLLEIRAVKIAYERALEGKSHEHQRIVERRRRAQSPAKSRSWTMLNAGSLESDDDY